MSERPIKKGFTFWITDSQLSLLIGLLNYVEIENEEQIAEIQKLLKKFRREKGT